MNKWGTNSYCGSPDLVSRVALILLFKICLDVSTVLVSSQALGKYSIELNYDLTGIAVGYCAALFLAVCLPSWSRKLDELFVWILVLFVGIPLIIPYQWSGASLTWMLTSTLFLGALGAQSRVRLLQIKPFEFIGGWWILGMFLGGVAAYSLLSSVLIVGLTPTFDFSVVYEIRDRFEEQRLPLATYAYKWTAFVVVPFLFILGRIRRIKWVWLSAVGMALILFFATGHKMYLLIPAFVFIIDWCVGCKKPFVWLVGGLSILVIAGTLTFYSFGDKRLNATFSNRLYVLPAKISYEYHEFFSTNPKVMLSHSVLAGSIDYPYTASPASIVAGRYYADPEGSPNTGILADAYMNFGYQGIVALWILVAVVLRLVRWIGDQRNIRLALSLTVVPIFTWVNSGFLTSFLTSGLALGIIGAFFLPLTTEQRGWYLISKKSIPSTLQNSRHTTTAFPVSDTTTDYA
jgi:hypothetical protein